MKEYITKDRAKQFVCGHCNEVCSEKPCESSDCDWMAFIDKEPAADVIEKKHGYWIKRIIENEQEDYPIRNVDYICSRCEGCWHEPLKYCPMCLAEMDKKVMPETLKEGKRVDSNCTCCCSESTAWTVDKKGRRQLLLV